MGYRAPSASFRNIPDWGGGITDCGTGLLSTRTSTGWKNRLTKTLTLSKNKYRVPNLGWSKSRHAELDL